MQRVSEIARHPRDEYEQRVVHREKSDAKRERAWAKQVAAQRRVFVAAFGRMCRVAAGLDHFAFGFANPRALRRLVGREYAPGDDPHQSERRDNHKRRAPAVRNGNQSDHRPSDRTAYRLARKRKADHGRRFMPGKPVGDGPVGRRIHRTFAEAEQRPGDQQRAKSSRGRSEPAENGPRPHRPGENPARPVLVGELPTDECEDGIAEEKTAEHHAELRR